MTVTTKPLLALTAADLMSAPVQTISQHMTLREAARLLAREQISGAPVIDPGGRCVGVLSATDFLRLAAQAGPAPEAADWGGVDLNRLPEAQVGEYMTADPIVVSAGTDIRGVARLMLDAHIHRVGVVDEANLLVGIVSSTDLLAALAYTGGETPTSEQG
jgi:CBS domain-containing protein